MIGVCRAAASRQRPVRQRRTIVAAVRPCSGGRASSSRVVAATDRKPVWSALHGGGKLTSDGRLDEMNDLVSGNKTFVARSVEKNADYFKSLAAGQSPDTLWLGCSDSRIPEATIADKGPGDIFVHRNIANIIKTGDLSAESAIEFAVRHLKVKKVVVCGHSRCGGAMASLGDADLGHSLNTWLEPLRELRKSHQEDINKLASADEKALQLAKLNVASSIAAVKAHSAVKEAIAERGLSVHGTIFHLETGTLEVLKQ